MYAVIVKDKDGKQVNTLCEILATYKGAKQYIKGIRYYCGKPCAYKFNIVKI